MIKERFRIIEKETDDWCKWVKESDRFDFYHTSFYHQIDNTFRSVLLLFECERSFIALPIVIRPIEGTPYFDVTSVYGYAGPISHYAEGFDKSLLIDFFQTQFLAFCRRENIVSCFARLNPLIEQKEILAGLGEVVALNKTVSIDLTLSAEEQRRNYRKSLKSELNQLRRKDIIVKEASSVFEIDKFVEIYYETMDRVEATPNYYFSKDYFHKFMDNPDFDSKLLLAYKGDRVIAGAIFTFTERIMQYHLAGTTEEFIHETPMKLILDEARLLGNASSAEILHLGGGVGGHDDDSLFRFKSGFSKDFKQFSIWKFIVNPGIYNRLVEEKDIKDRQSNFFPLYRSQ